MLAVSRAVRRCQVPGDQMPALSGSLAGAGGALSEDFSLPGARARFAVGSRIAGYVLEEQIGRGGMAMVFCARDERLGRPVALKIMAPALASDEAFRRRFIGESRKAASVDDPHIIPVHEAGEADGVLFIAMRYVRGGDVGSLVRNSGPLQPARVAAIVSPVASALDAAHAAGLVHRDVKPANMLLDVRSGRPDHIYLSDFGLAKQALSSVALTRSGQFLGTLYYSGPEQIEGKPVDGRTDQYALACSAFELLTGSPPFVHDQVPALMWAHMAQPPPRLTARRPDLPPAADAVLAKALAKAPADRYATCRDFGEALRRAFGLAPYDPDPGNVAPVWHPPTEVAYAGAAKPPSLPEPVTKTAHDASRQSPDDHAAAATAAEPAFEAERQARDKAELEAQEDRTRSIRVEGDPAGASDQLAALLPVRERNSGTEHPDTVPPGGPPTAEFLRPAATSMAPPGSAASRAGTAYVVCGSDGAITPIDLVARTAGTPISVGRRPGAIAIAPDGRTAYVCSRAEGTLTPVDLVAGTAREPIRIGRGPCAIAITPDGQIAVVAGIGARTATVTLMRLASCVAEPPIKIGSAPAAIAVTPDGATALLADGEAATVIPVSLPSGDVGDVIRIGSIPSAIAVAPDGATAYVASRYYGTIVPIDLATRTVRDRISLASATRLVPAESGNITTAIAITPDGTTAYIARGSAELGTVIPADLPSGAARSPIRVGRGPSAIAITADGMTAYVTNSTDGTVTPVDVATGFAAAPIQVGRRPEAIAIAR